MCAASDYAQLISFQHLYTFTYRYHKVVVILSHFGTFNHMEIPFYSYVQISTKMQHIAWHYWDNRTSQGFTDLLKHYIDVIMGVMASQITSLAIVCSAVHLGADQRKHQNSASLAFVPGIQRWAVNSPHKWTATRKMFPFNDVIMTVPYGLECLPW